MEQIINNINRLNGYVEQQSTGVSRSSSAVSESTGNTLIRFEVIDSDIKTVSEQAENIRGAME